MSWWEFAAMAQAGAEQRPTDPDVDLHVSGQRAELRRAPWGVLGAISSGGAIGALARYGIGVAVPATPTGFAWGTFAINVSGCLLIGVLMVLITERYRVGPLVRPFLGVGVLGGFTTFSTYVVDIQRLAQGSTAGTALVYLLATVLAALAAVHLGGTLTRWATRPRRSGRAREGRE
jgi:CrcB protein